MTAARYVILALLVPAPLVAGPPGLRTIFPPAAQRGVESELRVDGADMVPATELLLPFPAEVRGAGAGKESARFTVKPGKDVPPGVYPVRLRTPAGISNLRLLAVTDCPVVPVKTPGAGYKAGRPDPDKAQPLPWPCVVVGHRLEREIDSFRLAVKANDRLTLVTETWRTGLTPDPLIRLRDPGGRILAYAHDTPTLQRDERVDHTFDKAGDYLVDIESTGGGGWTNHYLLKVGPFDYARAVFPLGGRRGETVKFTVTGRDGKEAVIEAKVPSDPWADHWRLPLPDHPGSLPWTLASGDYPEVLEEPDRTGPQRLAWPVTVNGRIDKPGEPDLYSISVKPGQHVRVRAEAYHLGSRLDGYLLVYDPKGKKLLAKNDDQGYRGLPDPGLTFEVPAGVEEVEIALHDVLGRGGVDCGYRLTVERGGPDFYLWLGNKQGPTNEEDVGWHRLDRSDTLSLPPGQEVKLRLSVRRSAKEDDSHYAGPIQGYTGPIKVRAENVPEGVTVKPLEIPAGKTEGELIVVASEKAPREPFEIVVIGEGARPDGSVIRRQAERRLYLSDPQVPNLPWNWRVTKVTCAVAEKGGGR